MAKIAIEINTCKECPHFKTMNYWSSDDFDRMEDWCCTKHSENSMPIRNKNGDIISTNNPGKLIQGCVEWHEELKIKVPNWCPIKV